MYSKFLIFITLCLTGLFCSVPVFSATGDPVVTIGLIYDGFEDQQTRLLEMKSELNALLGSRYDIRLSGDTVYNSNWSLDYIEKSYDKLLTNKQVDIILGVGTLASSVIAKRGMFPKPVILIGIFDPDIQGLEPLNNNSSGVHNLTYILSKKSIVKDLATFYEVYPYKKIGFVFYGELLNMVDASGEDKLEKFANRNNTSIVNIPVYNGIRDVLDELDKVDSVYIGYLGEFEGSEKLNLVTELNNRKIPTFGSSSQDVNDGMLAAITHEGVSTIFMRRISLNVEAILEGEDPADLKVFTDFDETLTINMKTAEDIGYYPKYSVLSGAELINENLQKDVRTINLIDTMKEAMDANLDIQLSEMNVALAEQEIDLAKSDYYPSFTIGASGVIIDKERAEKSFGANAERTLSSDITATQLIYSDQVLGNIKTQKYLHDASRQGNESLKLDVALEAGTAYFNILRLKTNRKIFKDNVELIKKNLKISEQRETIGYSGRSDVLRWQSQLATAKTDYLSAQQDVLLAKYELNRILNKDQDDTFNIQDATLDDNIFQIYSSEEIAKYIDNQKSHDIFTEFLIQESRDNSPELKELEANRNALSRVLTSLKRKRYVPSIGFQAGHEHIFSREGEGSDVPGADPVDDPWSAGVALTIPIFEGGATSSRIQKTRIELSKLDKQKRIIEQGLEVNARNAISNAMVKMVNLSSSRKAADYAGQSLELIQDSYSKGTVSTIELADAQNNALTSDLATINSTYEYLISLLRIERVTGEYMILKTGSAQESLANRFQTYSNSRR